MIMTYHERRICNERTQTIAMGITVQVQVVER